MLSRGRSAEPNIHRGPGLDGCRTIGHMPRSTSLRFRSRITIAAAVAVLALAPLPTERSADAAIGDQLLPNLVATPATNIAFGTGTELRFSTYSWNAGAGPLELSAGVINSATNSQDVWQRIYLSGGGRTDRLAGNFVWHAAHNHFHFEGYALYTLQPADAAGGSSRTGQKTTFCVMDTNAKDLTLAGAPPNGQYTTCGNDTQGMSVGWGDRYSSSLAGQSIEMSGMTNGDYRLYIDIDPNQHLSESTRADNQSCVLLRISVTARTVSVLNPTGCTPPVVADASSMTPESLASGTSATATIKGTGFTAGLAVSFVNGNGTAPTISGLTIVDSTTATATIAIRRKAKLGADPVWDLRFGSDTLVDALRITP